MSSRRGIQARRPSQSLCHPTEMKESLTISEIFRDVSTSLDMTKTAQRMSQRLHGITSAIQARWFGNRSADVSLLWTGTTSKSASTDLMKSDAANPVLPRMQRASFFQRAGNEKIDIVVRDRAQNSIGRISLTIMNWRIARQLQAPENVLKLLCCLVVPLADINQTQI